MTYLSLAPEGLREVFIAGGLPPLERGPDDIYRETYRLCARKNRCYYERYPEDIERVQQIVEHLGKRLFAAVRARRRRSASGTVAACRRHYRRLISVDARQTQGPCRKLARGV